MFTNLKSDNLLKNYVNFKTQNAATSVVRQLKTLARSVKIFT